MAEKNNYNKLNNNNNILYNRYTLFPKILILDLNC